MHDRYRNWAIPYERAARAALPLPGRKSIEEQVLEDLASTDNELEKLEILDSYAGYAQRYYRAKMVEGFAQESGRIATSIFGPWVRELIPQVQVIHRAAKASEKTAL